MAQQASPSLPLLPCTRQQAIRQSPDDPNASDEEVDAQPSNIASSALRARNLRCLLTLDMRLLVLADKEKKR
jgi:hypothetical protein